MMASYRLFGVTEFAARLGPALCGLLTAAFVFRIGKAVEQIESRCRFRIRTRVGEWSALVFLSSFGAIAFSRAASFDIVLTMTLTGALCCFIVAQLSGASGRLTMLAAFYFFVGLSLLAKGLVGIVLPFGIITMYLALRRDMAEQDLSRKSPVGTSPNLCRVRVVVRADDLPARVDVHRSVHRATSFRAVPFKQVSPSPAVLLYVPVWC
jgi:4-amino-4-deoxy-L-arabinose transferase-like glycosyltransferase